MGEGELEEEGALRQTPQEDPFVLPIDRRRPVGLQAVSGIEDAGRDGDFLELRKGGAGGDFGKEIDRRAALDLEGSQVDRPLAALLDDDLDLGGFGSVVGLEGPGPAVEAGGADRKVVDALLQGPDLEGIAGPAAEKTSSSASTGIGWSSPASSAAPSAGLPAIGRAPASRTRAETVSGSAQSSAQTTVAARPEAGSIVASISSSSRLSAISTSSSGLGFSRLPATARRIRP